MLERQEKHGLAKGDMAQKKRRGALGDDDEKTVDKVNGSDSD